MFKSLFWALGKLYNNKYKTSVDQKFIIERIIINLVCSSRCPVNSFTDVSLIMVADGENVFWVTRGFFVAIPQVATGKKLVSIGVVSRSYYTSMGQQLMVLTALTVLTWGEGEPEGGRYTSTVTASIGTVLSAVNAM